VTTVDVSSIAVESGLPRGVINTGIVGLLARAIDIIDINSLIKSIKDEFGTRMPAENSKAALLSYERGVTGV
jgi:Pyruvate/2-oxoacid:ferredoxin oxidoreductase gamma subunit